MDDKLVEISNLRVSFRNDDGWHEVVHGISYSLTQGRTLGIVGESGSGKSVSSLALMRLLNEKTTRITADSIMLQEDEIKELDTKEMGRVRGGVISMIFQEPMTSLNPVYKCGFQAL